MPVSYTHLQLGDGFTNLIVPTSAVMMASIGAARIDWATWAKWQIKFQGAVSYTHLDVYKRQHLYSSIITSIFLGKIFYCHGRVF